MPCSSTENGSAAPSLKTWLLCAILCALAALPYCASLNAPFILDDNEKIVQSQLVLEGGLSFETLSKILHSPDAPRLVPVFSFVANHAAFGLDRIAFRLVNIAIHCANAILLFLVGMRLLAQAMPHGASRMAAFFAALLWSLNPLMLTSVAYIVQRENSLAAMFCLGAFLCYLEGRSRSGRAFYGLFALAFLLWLAAMLSKQNAAPLPALLLLCEMLVFRRRDRKFLLVSLAVLLAAGLLAVLAAGLTLRWDFGSVFRHYSNLNFTLGERLLSEPRAVALYILAFLFPLPSLLRLDMDDFPVSHGLLSPPSTLLSILFLAGLLALALRLWKREPLLAFSIAWLFGMLLVESSFISLELAYLHRLYLPGTMLALAISYLAFKHLGGRKVASALAALAALYGVATFGWSLQWRNEIGFWKSELAKGPHNLRALTSLGIACQNAGRNDEALNIYERALLLNPSLWRCHCNAGIILMESGDFAGAEKHLRAAFALLPENPDTAKALGVLLAKTGRSDEAAKLFSQASSKQSALEAGADYNLGLVEASKGDFNKALALFDSELRRSPSNWKIWKAKADAHASLEQAVEAAKAYSNAVALNPQCAEANCGLGLALFNMGRYQDAAASFEKALAGGLASAEVERGLGSALAMSGKRKDAEAHLRKSLALEPNSVETINTLATLRAMSGSYQEAESLFKSALKIRPDDPTASDNLRKLRARKERSMQ